MMRAPRPCGSSRRDSFAKGGPPRRYGMSIGVLQANDLGGTSQDFVCLRLLMCALGRHRSVGPLRARTGTYCSGSGGFCVTKTLTSIKAVLKFGLQFRDN